MNRFINDIDFFVENMIQNTFSQKDNSTFLNQFCFNSYYNNIKNEKFNTFIGNSIY